MQRMENQSKLKNSQKDPINEVLDTVLIKSGTADDLDSMESNDIDRAGPAIGRDAEVIKSQVLVEESDEFDRDSNQNEKVTGSIRDALGISPIPVVASSDGGANDTAIKILDSKKSDEGNDLDASEVKDDEKLDDQVKKDEGEKNGDDDRQKKEEEDEVKISEKNDGDGEVTNEMNKAMV